MVSIQIQRRLFLLPIVSFIFLLASVFTTYGVAAGLGHVNPGFPYISYTGLKVPERGIFGQLLNMGAILLALNVCARYLRVKVYNTDVSCLNKTCLVLGLLSAFGQTMVANFETVVMRGPHYVGAALGFGVGGIYCWIQTVLSWRLRHESRITRHLVFWSQLLISVLISVFAITFSVSKIIFKGYKNDEAKNEEGPVRTAYLTSTVAEWLLAISIMFFLLTYVPEFRNVTVKPPCVECDSVGNVAGSNNRLDVDSKLMEKNGNSSV
ncbi:DNA damage-regulated autophagy modulator protein 2-like [Liolophura sinensis]|uniref:DNA damage-regulated autophagy modulator protein 2-like n=1 Tax=Liolophura sinensis TaxID=3198878 RepID=UPI00315960C7